MSGRDLLPSVDGQEPAALVTPEARAAAATLIRLSVTAAAHIRRLAEALKALLRAPEIFTHGPDGASLARLVNHVYHLIAPTLDEETERRLRETARQVAQARREGATVTNTRRHAEAEARNALIRARAATADLSETAKATILTREFPLSVRHLRRILKK